MRTTLTLDPDARALIIRLMDERDMTFKDAVNYAIRKGLGHGGPEFRMRTFSMGQPAIPLEKALQLAGEMEDEHLIARLALRK